MENCDELKDWLIEHDDVLSVRTTAQGASWEARFVPGVCAYCLAHEWNAALGSDTMAGLKGNVAGNYVLRIRNGGQVEPRSAAVALWEDQDLAGRIKITCGVDTVPCVFAHVEAAGAMISGRDLLLGFDEDFRTRDHVLIIQLPNGGGTVRFPFRKEPLMRLEARLPASWRVRPESPRS